MDRQLIQNKLIRQLKEWEPEIEELKALAVKAKKETQEVFLGLLDDYKALEKDFLKGVAALEKASGEALKDAEKGLEKILHDLQLTFKKMSSHFK